MGVAFTPDFPLEQIDVVEKVSGRGGDGGAENRKITKLEGYILL